MIAILLALSFLVPPTLQAEPLRERDVKELVLEWVDDDTGGLRRGEILQMLATADVRHVDRALRPVISRRGMDSDATDLDTRQRISQGSTAILLAAHLRVTGLWTMTRRYLDTKARTLVIYLGLRSEDKKAISYLFKAWEKATPGDPEFQELEKAFTETSLGDFANIKMFVRHLSSTNTARRASARKIISFQCGTGPISILVLRDRLRDLEREFRLDGKSFRVSGRDLLQNPRVEAPGALRRGQNLRLPVGSYLSIALPGEELEGKTFTIKCQVRPLGPDVRLLLKHDLKGQERTWRLELDKKEWFVRAASRVFTATRNLEEWQEVEFTVTPEEPDRRCLRHSAVSVQGQVLLKKGCTNGALKEFRIEAEKSALVVGGLELVVQGAGK